MQRCLHLSGRARRLVFAAALSAATTYCLAARPAWADPVPPTNSALPTISGTPQQGDQLTADPGTWSGDTPITYDYQWSDGQTGNPIPADGLQLFVMDLMKAGVGKDEVTKMGREVAGSLLMG